MNNITPEQRAKRFEESTKDIQNLYASSESGAYLRSVFATYNLEEEKYRPYAIIIGNVILGLTSISLLPEELQKNAGFSPETAQNITKDLLEFLSPVLEQTEKSTPLPEPVSTTSLQANAEPSVKQFRTMEGDMDRVHGYGAYRKMFPDAQQGNAGAQKPTDTAYTNPSSDTDEDTVISSLPQDAVLKKEEPPTLDQSGDK